MVREGDRKYFRVDNGDGWREQLFDLSRDPDEVHNLIDDSAYTEARSRLRSRVFVLPPPRQKDADNRFIHPYHSMNGDRSLTSPRPNVLLIITD